MVERKLDYCRENVKKWFGAVTLKREKERQA